MKQLLPVINHPSHVTTHHDWTSESTKRLRESRTYNLKQLDRIICQTCVLCDPSSHSNWHDHVLTLAGLGQARAARGRTSVLGGGLGLTVDKRIGGPSCEWSQRMHTTGDSAGENLAVSLQRELIMYAMHLIAFITMSAHTYKNASCFILMSNCLQGGANVH